MRYAEPTVMCLQVTKIVGKRKNAVNYMFRCSFPLYGVSVQLLDTPCEHLPCLMMVIFFLIIYCPHHSFQCPVLSQCDYLLSIRLCD